MEPLSALSLATSIVQFIDFGTRLFATANEIRQSSSGLTRGDLSLEVIARELHEFTSQRPTSGLKLETEGDKALSRLAIECQYVAERIMRLTQDITPRNPGSLLSTMNAAWKSRRRADEKEALVRSLDNCRKQFELQLNSILNSEIKGKLAQLKGSAASNTRTMHVLHEHVEDLRRGIKVTTISQEAQQQLRHLLGLSEEVNDTIAQHIIQRSLAWHRRNERFERVADAHADTFQWVLREGKVEESSHVSTARRNLREWLSSGDGIFHLSGKLGSGKSTLMKYLVEHSVTGKLLTNWAGDKKLVVASFFFWRQGAKEQKSFNGLIQHILHDVLKECPELIPDLFPLQWKEVRSKQTYVRTMDKVEFKAKDIEEAFSALTTRRGIFQAHRFCFFIDALDEFLDSHQRDHSYLVDALDKWVKYSNGAIKMCVSSREYPVFTNAFASHKKIRLQDLTQMDMENYVQEKLAKVEDHDERARVVRTIVDRSSGIFLWVALVVKTLRECLEDGRGLSGLEVELARMPGEMEELFQHLFDTIPGATKTYAHRILALLTEITRLGGSGLPLICCPPPEDIYRKSNSTAHVLSTVRSTECATSIRSKHLDLIKGCCRGLVDSNTNTPWDTHRLIFSHRSIIEFLLGKVRKQLVRAFLPESLAGGFVSAVLAALRKQNFRSDDIPTLPSSCNPGIPFQCYCSPQTVWFELITIAVLACIQEKDKKDLFILIAALEAEIDIKIPLCRARWPTCMHHGISGNIRIDSPDIGHWVPVALPLVVMAAHGRCDYVMFRIHQDPSFLQNPDISSFLLASVFCGIDGMRNESDFHAFMVSTTALMDGANFSVTEWDRLWGVMLCNFGSFRKSSSDLMRSMAVGKVMALFLQQRRRRDLHLTELYYWITDSQESFRLYACWAGRVIHRQYHSDGFYTPTVQFLIDRGATEDNPLGVRALIEFWDFDNKGEILGLIDDLEKENIRGGEILGAVNESNSDSGAVEDTTSPEDNGVHDPHSTLNAGCKGPQEAETQSTGIQISSPKAHTVGTDRNPASIERLRVCLFIALSAFLAFVITRQSQMG